MFRGIRLRDVLHALALFAGGAALVVAINSVGDNASKEGREAAAQEVKRQLVAERYHQDIATWHKLQDGCGRSTADRRASIKRDRDLWQLASQAASARRASGDIEVAIGYEKIAGNTLRRIAQTRSRIIPCTDAFPKPKTPPGVEPLL